MKEVCTQHSHHHPIPVKGRELLLHCQDLSSTARQILQCPTYPLNWHLCTYAPTLPLFFYLRSSYPMQNRRKAHSCMVQASAKKGRCHDETASCHGNLMPKIYANWLMLTRTPHNHDLHQNRCNATPWTKQTMKGRGKFRREEVRSGPQHIPIWNIPFAPCPYGITTVLK